MQGTDPPTFRPTLWPGPLGCSQAVARELDDPVAGLAAQSGRARGIDLPADFAIREVLNPAPGVADDVLAFMREWGWLCRPGGASLDSLPKIERDHLAAEVAAEVANAESMGVPTAVREVSVSLVSAARHLALLQSCARHVIAFLDGDAESLVAAWHGLGHESPPADTRAAWMFWQTYNTSALRPFQAHLRLEEDDSQARLLLPEPTTYELAMLQLAEIASGQSGPLPRCANERCGLPFVRQRGRAKYDGTHHATGVRYCSHRCAKAQSERVRRQRRKGSK